MQRTRQAGFSLVELMVVVAVLFVITAIAMPFYRDYVHTSRLGVMQGKVEQFRAFEENYRIDSGTYLVGSYVPGGTNSFLVPLGYQLPGDHDGISFTVSAGACGNIVNCYQVVVTSKEGDTGTYQSQTGRWTWP